MTTTRQIERFWQAKDYARLLVQLLSGRSENFVRVRTDTEPRLATAALALVRLDEFNQSHTSVCGELVRTLLSAQEADGGWGDPMTTSLCVRALKTARGQGIAIERGLEALANLQKIDGSFPAEPLRRMPSDAFVTAFVLYEVGCDAQHIRVDEALMWLDAHTGSLDDATRVLRDRLNIRCHRVPTGRNVHSQFAWS